MCDGAFNEINNRARTGHTDEKLAVISHTALNLVKRETSAEVGIKNRRLKAAWDDAYLTQIVFA